MKPDTIQVPAIFSGFSSRADGGATLRFATNELNDVDFGALKKMHNTFGFVLFRANEFRDEDVPKADALDDTKSPSQRLRGALYIYWQQRGVAGDFESFYRVEMQKFIDDVKKLID